MIQRIALGLTLTAAAVAASAQSPATIKPDADTNAPHNWTKEQILTCTVSQCWQLAGKSEDTFFDIVQQLAAISAQNRNITLPNDAAAGQRVGNYIKIKAKADRQALLFSIVDASVRHLGAKASSKAAQQN
ncbi:MAG: hypothetical protein M3Y50_08405 [Acidobacteriota bacterium]|nr:hypothetical protein [Acidobacteriota bacterium]